MRPGAPVYFALVSGYCFLLSVLVCVAATAAEPSPTSSPETTPSALVLPEMTVTARPEPATGYNVPNATSATKTDTPIFDTPVSIHVIPRELLDDQQAFTAQEALKNISGIQPDFSGVGPFNQAFHLRGFSTEWNTVGSLAYREGVRLKAPIPFASLERIELLKGPATVLYGQAVAGGIINYIPKDPLAHPYYSLQQQFGSYDLYRTSVDATGPINDTGSLRYRLNLEYVNSGSFVDQLFADVIDVAPTLAWDITPDTQVELEFQFNEQDYRIDQGIPAIGNRPADLRRGINLMDGIAHETEGVRLVDIDLNHRITDAWQVRLKGLYAQYDLDIDDLVYPIGLDESTGELSRSGYEEDDDGEVGFFSANLIGKLDIFGMKHTLLMGGDYYNEDTESIIAATDTTSINIFNPVFGLATRTEFTPDNTFSFPYWNKWWGVYIQDQIDVLDNLHLLLGGRYDDAEWFFNVEGSVPPSEDSAVNPRFGLVYQPWQWLALYGSYSEGFEPKGGSQSPETSQQYEVGAKTDLMGGRLSATLAFYELTKSDIETDNPNTPDPNDRLIIGEARSQGIELDILGRVTDKLSVISAYAYTDTEILEDISGRKGNRLNNVPRHAGSVWATYDLTEQFSVGAGVYAVGEREVDQDNTAQMPGYVRVDAMAAYRWKIGGSRLTAQVNINNLLDKEYFVTGGNRNFIRFGDPITVLGSLRLEY